MDVRRFFSEHYVRRLRAKGVADSTITEYRAIVRQLPAEPTLENLTAWLAGLKLAPATRNRYRRYLLALLREAQRMGFCSDGWFVDLPVARVARKLPRAWTVAEFGKLLEAASSVRERYCGITGAAWWQSLLLAAWYTGARVGTLNDALRNNLDLVAGHLVVISPKDQAEILYHLPDDCVRAIRRMGVVTAPLIWPWPWKDRKRTQLRRIRQLIETAKLPQIKQPFHAIRRSVASYVAASAGVAQACRVLDHSRPQVTRRYYLDPRIARLDVSVAEHVPRPHFRAS